MKKKMFIIIYIIFTSISLYAQNKDQIISFLYEKEEERTPHNIEIVFMEEYNFGIPGGTNWLVEWQWFQDDRKQRMLTTYVADIDNNEIKFREMILILGSNWPSYIISWYQSLPGITIDSDLCQIIDINGDGYDEILQIIEGGTGNRLEIQGYNPQSNKFEWYCDVPINITRRNDQPSPVEFLNYKGMYGLKALSPNNKWFFYTWDETQRKYIEVEEVDPRYLEEEARLYQREKEELSSNEIEQTLDSETSLENETPIASKDSQFPLWLFIGGGLVLLGVGVGVIIVVKRKK